MALAVTASYDSNGELNSDMLKDNLNSIEGLKPKVTTVTFDLEVIVDGFKFTISSTGKITGEKMETTAELPENTPQNPQAAGTDVALKDGWDTETMSYIRTSNGTEVTTLEKVATVYAVSVGSGDTVPVPKGFYYVGGTIDTGVVISDDERDRNKFINFTNTTDVPTGIPAGVIYNTDGTVKAENSLSDTEKAQVIFGNQFVWIPCSSTTNYKKTDWKYRNSAWDTITPKSEKVQIEKYGGFYIGRYEAGTSNIAFDDNASLLNPTGTSNYQNGKFVYTKASGTITTKAGEIPYFHSDYTTAVNMAERMYINDSTRKYSVSSGLTTGTMWDVVLDYLIDKNSSDNTFSVSNSSTWGNYNYDSGVVYSSGKGRYIGVSSGTEYTQEVNHENVYWVASNESYHNGIRTTASSESVKKNNIYDLAGNLWEWTEESASTGYTYPTGSYILRGGSYGNAGSNADLPICFRLHSALSTTDTAFGFRPVLYIK